MVKILFSLFYYEIIKINNPKNLWNPLAFLLTSFSLLLVSFEPSKVIALQNFNLFWIIFLFIVNLNFSLFLKDDYEDGTIDLIRLSPISFEWILIIKFLGHWIRLIGPLFLFLIIIGFVVGTSFENSVQFLLSLLMSSLFLCAVTAFISMLSLGGKISSYISPLLSLPLNIPLLIINNMNMSFILKISFLGGFLSFIFPLFLLAKKCILELKNP